MTKIDKYWKQKLKFFNPKNEDTFIAGCEIFNLAGQKYDDKIELKLLVHGNCNPIYLNISYKDGKQKSRVTINGNKEFYCQPEFIFQALEDILTLTMGQYLKKPREFFLANIDKCSGIFDNGLTYSLDYNKNVYIAFKANKIVVDKYFNGEKNCLDYAYNPNTPLCDVVWFITNWLIGGTYDN